MRVNVQTPLMKRLRILLICEGIMSKTSGCFFVQSKSIFSKGIQIIVLQVVYQDDTCQGKPRGASTTSRCGEEEEELFM